jgi:class 3 adenylate cyclase
MQRAISRRQISDAEAPWLGMRVGLHVGEPIRVGGDLFGVPVATASRVCNSAQAGQIAITDPVRAIAGPRGQYEFRDLGVRRFRGLREPVHLWEVIWETGDVAARDAAPPAPGPIADLDRPHETATILFADIVASTALTEELGDTWFRRRTQELDTVLRRTIRHHRGTPVEGKLMGDGVLAVFASARDAVLCAMACVGASEPVGLQLHLGIHAGDVIRDGDNVYGGAVNIAARISDCTGPGEILMSETVRGLARTSAGVTFEDRGERMLKGVAEPLRVYTVRAPAQ